MARTPGSNSESSIDIISEWPTTDTSDDEVVWGISDEFSSVSSLSDFVLLPRTRRAAPSQGSESSNDSISETGLSLPFDLLSITTSSKAGDESHTNEISQPRQKPTRRGKCKARQTSGVKSQDVITPSTSRFSSGAVTPTSSYEDAAAFITQYLASPVEERRTIGKLQLLQALVVELGVSKQIPTSIRSARKLLKAGIHVNIKEYVTVRGKDQDALRQIMHPSKSALRNSIRKGRKQPLKWVKEHGLDVFLIGCYN